MSNSLRIALPGYNAYTDTNPDHFALDPDTTTNILIKEVARGSVVIAAGGNQTIAHNLGYIPYFMVFANGQFVVNGNNKSGYLPCSAGGTISPPTFEAYADTTNVYILNNSSNSATFWYYVFYDNVSGTSANNITFSKRSIRVALSGKNALTSKDPNDFKYHSDFNTLKIINQNKQTVSVGTGSNTYTITHNAKSTTPLFAIYVQFPDGYATPLSFPNIKSYSNASSGSEGKSLNTTWWDDTNIYLYFASVGTAYSVTIVWIEFEPELS